jgi:DHA3 family tetracycline resistance protein-like MFS transporter
MVALSAHRLWYLSEGAAWGFAWSMVFTVAAVYFVRDVGMSPFELVVLGTAMELAYFTFEVPTAVVADTYGRRLSVVIGTVLLGVSIALVGAFTTYVPILLSFALMGFGWTFTSGAFDAWLADEVGPRNVGPVYQRGAQIKRAAALAGIAAGVALALIDLRVPIVAGGAMWIALGVAFAFLMPERGFPGRGKERVALTGTARNGVRLVRARPLLVLVLGIAAFGGMWSEAVDRLWQAHFIRDVRLPSFAGLDSVVWFGVFGAGSLLLAFLVAAPVRRRLEQAGRETTVKILFALDAVLIVSTAGFAMAGSLALALCAFWTISVTRSLAAPLYMTWLNQSIDDSRVRATVISITNLADSVGQWGGGPALGGIGSVFSIRAALAAAAAALSPALLLYARALRHHGREPELERLPQPAGAR